jgi:TolB-like protein
LVKNLFGFWAIHHYHKCEAIRILGALIMAIALPISGLCLKAKDVEPHYRRPLRGEPTLVPQNSLEPSLADLTKQISEGLAENQKRTIAVVEFADLQGRVTDFGRFLAEKLITRLYQTKKFKVIERQLLNKIVTEQKLSLTGMIDQSTAQRLGKLLGVDAIASGTVTDLGKTVDINARLINTQTGEIFAVASVEITKDDAVLKLMGEAAYKQNSNEGNIPPGEKGSQKVEAKSFTFQLLQCSRLGGTVSCDLLITNNDTERKLAFNKAETGRSFQPARPYGSPPIDRIDSVFYDDMGNSHPWRGGQIANSTGWAVLVSGVQTKARITFDDIPSQVTRCALLSLSFETAKIGGNGWNETFKVEFRGVPLGEQRVNG